eukprot:299595_1
MFFNQLNDHMEFPPLPPIPIIINNQYSFIKSPIYTIGTGFYHDTYYGMDTSTNQHVAIKCNHHNNKHENVYLKWQYQKYKSMKGGLGIPNIHWFGQIDGYYIVIMDLFDATLKQLFTFCDRNFSLKTILMIANKLLLTIEHIHNTKNIYRNVNPMHFVVKQRDIYFVGFGNVNYYINPKTQKHIRFMKGLRMKNVRRYASVNEHLGSQISRRDDLESIGYVLLYFLCNGKLPWSGLKRTSEKDVIGETKINIPMEYLCKRFNIPKEFELYLTYCRTLKFEEKPNYDYLKQLFNDLNAQKEYDKEQFIWDWDLRKLVLIHGYYRVMNENKSMLSIDIIQLISTYIIPIFDKPHQSTNSTSKRKYDIV